MSDPRTTVLVDDGRPRAQVVVPEGASPSLQHAARLVTDAVHRVTGVQLPVVAAPGHDLTTTVRLSASLSIGPDAVSVKGGRDWLAITGGSDAALVDAGTLVAEACGVRALAADCVVAPTSGSLVLPPLDLHHVPAFGYRDVFADAATDPAWATANRLNGWVTSPGPERGHGAGWAWPPFHTFAWLLPAGRHFAAEPSCFTLVDGERRTSQFCLSSPRTLELVTERVLAWMERTPEQRFYSMTQNDNNDFCQCRECARRTEEQGSPQGALLPFVNAVGEAVAAAFPDKQLVTFAYAATLPPPRDVVPADNVWVQVCALTSPGDLIAALDGWRRLTDQVVVWEYFTGFTHYLVPNPTLDRAANDLRWYRDQGVRGVFAQAAYQSPGADLAELRSYVLAQLLWDPDRRVDDLVDEFLPSYYGGAAPYVQEYVDLASAALRRVGYGNPPSYAVAELMGQQDPSLAGVIATWWVAPARGAWLNDGALRAYTALFDAAERAVGDDSLLRARVERSRLPVDAVAAVAGLRRGNADPALERRVVDTGRREGVTRWGEWTFFDELVAEVAGWGERAAAVSPLDEGALAAFGRDGYLVVPGTGLDPASLARELARVCRGEWDCLGAGLAPLPRGTTDDEALETLPSFNLPHQLGPGLWEASVTPRLLALAAQLLGAVAHPVFSRGHVRTAGMPAVPLARAGDGLLWMSPWTGRFESPEVSVGLHLPLSEDAAADPVSVVPGSHLDDSASEPVDVRVPLGGALLLHGGVRWGLSASTAPRPAPSLDLHYAPATGVPQLPDAPE